ncbi:MAG: universal stress protein [Spirulinaceae cyanobacterium]
MIKKILLADAGMSNPKEMFNSLRDLPAIQDVAVTILNVVPPQTSTATMNERLSAADTLLEQTIADLKLPANAVATLKRQGDPKAIVCEVANEIDADLIIMGSRGLKRLESILENSVSQYVFQLTNRPMLLVRDDIYVKKLKRIMVALDKSSDSQYPLELALFLARGTDVELLLTRVNPDLDPAFVPTAKAEIEANPVIAAALPQVKRMGVKYRGIVAGGRPGVQLCKMAEEYNADLLILGSPDRRPSIARALPDLDRLLGTSLSDYVRVNAECPVLLARRDEA